MTPAGSNGITLTPRHTGCLGCGVTRRRQGSKVRNVNFRSALGDAVDHVVDRRSSPIAHLKAQEVSGDDDLAMERFADDC